MVVTLTDTRKSTRVFEAAREESFVASPEALASLPGRLNSLVRGAGGDAQIELSKFLKRLTEPEPPVEEPLPASASPGPSKCVAPEQETPVAEASSAPAPIPTPPPDDYVLPLSLSLLGTLP